MRNDRKFSGGWKTMMDGTRVQITESEAAELWAAIERTEAQQAADYPTTYSALCAHIDADERLQKLGWKKHIFNLTDGEELALIEWGSTGIFRATWKKPCLLYHDCVAQMGKVFIKRVSDLTDDERDRMEKCSADHAEFMKHQHERMSRVAEVMMGEETTNE